MLSPMGFEYESVHSEHSTTPADLERAIASESWQAVHLCVLELLSSGAVDYWWQIPSLGDIVESQGFREYEAFINTKLVEIPCV